MNTYIPPIEQIARILCSDIHSEYHLGTYFGHLRDFRNMFLGEVSCAAFDIYCLAEFALEQYHSLPRINNDIIWIGIVCITETELSVVIREEFSILIPKVNMSKQKFDNTWSWLLVEPTVIDEFFALIKTLAEIVYGRRNHYQTFNVTSG